ncbi:hypothetical protein FLK61_38305 [Paenalkalicoccus suaedae]|uniref:Uncharacterized protein n=1 Tax=Paenalkalicoccus suaedae TaxID=2592382 RepID=A0A859FHD4_9BACI|nr:hypothetical protein [Paenalkalicoccus suaedae]QKS72481.1 hypothetical protein FLK61_38305 [Paenalkalicoccus suaedae]
MKKLREMYIEAVSHLQNEKGSQSLEWIGIAAVIVIVVGMISTVFAGDTEFGEAIKDRLISFVEGIG